MTEAAAELTSAALALHAQEAILEINSVRWNYLLAILRSSSSADSKNLQRKKRCTNFWQMSLEKSKNNLVGVITQLMKEELWYTSCLLDLL